MAALHAITKPRDFIPRATLRLPEMSSVRLAARDLRLVGAKDVFVDRGQTVDVSGVCASAR